MCGIVGIISNSKECDNSKIVKRMADSISHRGPDGEGYWKTEDNRVNLGHRRLSIIDLSEAGNQPMIYEDRYVIVFNGEIYNYKELKAGLISRGFIFHSSSDTEVLLALYKDKGELCLNELDGMFAFVIYDKITHEIFCARDRFGEKPFFYYLEEDVFYFASEIKALWEAGVERCRNQKMSTSYLYAGTLTNSENLAQTYYENIYKLPASHYFKFLLGQTIKILPKRYWDIDRFNLIEKKDENVIISHLHDLLTNSIERRLRSDVPIGSSLSGGLDSSIIVSVINEILKKSENPQKTFSAHFPGFKKDERKYQEILLKTVKADAFFVAPSSKSMIDNLEKVIYHQDEPFSSPSILAQFEVFELAKKHNVTVLLDGQGADEIFAGYHGYYHAFFDELLKSNKTEYQKQLTAYQNLHADNSINGLQSRSKYGALKQFVPSNILGRLMDFRSKKAMKSEFFTKEFESNCMDEVIVTRNSYSRLNDSLYDSIFNNGLEDLLRFADRNSMANSREVRLPFLSHEVVEFVFSLPSTYKINNGWTKWVLRKAFEVNLPNEIVWRKDKIGYEPLFRWDDLSFMDLINDKFNKLKSDGILKKAVSVDEIFSSNSQLGWRLFNSSYY